MTKTSDASASAPVTDLTPALMEAYERRGGWGPEMLRSFLDCVMAKHRGVTADWDDDAGESWARLFAGGDVVGHVCVHAPLVFVRSPLNQAEVWSCASDVIVMAVPDFEAPVFAVEVPALRRLFPTVREFPTHALDERRLSIGDICWATI
jgi:hypothetical protein